MTVKQNGVEMNYVWIGEYKEGFAVVEIEDGKYNHIGKDGKLLSDTYWKNAYDFIEGFAIVQREDCKYNHIREDGTLISDTWWDDAWYFDYGYAHVEKNGRWNEINKDGHFRYFKAKKIKE